MKKIFYSFMGIFLILFSGCSIEDIKTSSLFSSSSNSGSSNNDENKLNINKGVEVIFDDENFEENYFPDERYGGNLIFQNFLNDEVMVSFKFIGGLSKIYQSGLYNKKNIKIQKATKYISPQIKIFSYKNFFFKNINSNIQTNLKLKYCYNSKTNFEQPITIKKNSYELGEKYLNGVIDISVEKFLKSGKKAKIIFSIKNKNNGVVINNCFNEKKEGDYTYEFFFSNNKIKCEKSGSLKFYNNKYDDNKITCDFNVDDDDVTYIISGNLNYKYEDTISKKIKIYENLE